MKKHVVFRLGQERYAIDIANVESIERVPEISHIPTPNEYVKGIFFIRGHAVPVVDLRSYFRMAPSEINEDCRVILLSFDDLKIGILVDSADNVVDIDMDTVQAAPEILGTIEKSYLRGIAQLPNYIVALLNLEALARSAQVPEGETELAVNLSNHTS